MFKVGDKVTTYFMKDWGNRIPNIRQFEIVGIYSSGLQQFDANIVIGDIKHVQRLNRWAENQVGAFEVVLLDFDKIEECSRCGGILAFDCFFILLCNIIKKGG